MLVGSTYFFAGREGFVPHDCDVLKIVIQPKGFRFMRHTHAGDCLFEVADVPKADLLAFTLRPKASPLEMCKFCVKEFAEHFGITAAEMELLRPMVERMGKKHRYYVPIYEYIVAHNDWDIPSDVLDAAFADYKKAREDLQI